MRTLMLLIFAIALSGCATHRDRSAEFRENLAMHGPIHNDEYGYQVYKDGVYVKPNEALLASKRREAQSRSQADHDAFSKSVGGTTMAERNHSKPENPQQTACIHFGNAYVQAINIRNQWSFADPEDSYNAALNHVKAILSKYPQFNAKGIVDNVFYNPDFRYPVGGNPLLLQMSQLCMKETKQAEFKP